jgi:hypothetical protein
VGLGRGKVQGWFFHFGCQPCELPASSNVEAKILVLICIETNMVRKHSVTLAKPIADRGLQRWLSSNLPLVFEDDHRAIRTHDSEGMDRLKVGR